MKRCLDCGAAFDRQAQACPACARGPVLLDGVVSYAPELARGGGGFKPGYYADLARLEGANFWFRARNELILWAIRTYSPSFTSLLEIGCGTGYVLSGVADAYPQARLTGSEIFLAGLGFASDRVKSASFLQMDARDIPFQDEFDVVGAFDVIEHIAEDERVLAQTFTALKPGGVILVTVPQHAWLWSAADEYACHVRRYSAGEICRKIEGAGFQMLRSTSFVTALLPAMMISRLGGRSAGAKTFDPLSEFKIAPWLNTTLEKVLAVERGVIRLGLSLPIGGSRLVVAQKPRSATEDGLSR